MNGLTVICTQDSLTKDELYITFARQCVTKASIYCSIREREKREGEEKFLFVPFVSRD